MLLDGRPLHAPLAERARLGCDPDTLILPAGAPLDPSLVPGGGRFAEGRPRPWRARMRVRCRGGAPLRGHAAFLGSLRRPAMSDRGRDGGRSDRRREPRLRAPRLRSVLDERALAITARLPRARPLARGLQRSGSHRGVPPPPGSRPRRSLRGGLAAPRLRSLLRSPLERRRRRGAEPLAILLDRVSRTRRASSQSRGRGTCVTWPTRSHFAAR